MHFSEGEKIAQWDAATKAFERGEYEACTWESCSLHGADLSGSIFRECTFVRCDISMAQVKGATFRECTFRECKLVGFRFDQCTKVQGPLVFEGCALNFAVMAGVNVPKTIFRRCQMEGIQLEDTNLSQATFEDCQLEGAVFEQTNLEGADLRKAYGFVIDPQRNRLRKAKFAQNNLTGLLQSLDLVID